MKNNSFLSLLSLLVSLLLLPCTACAQWESGIVQWGITAGVQRPSVNLFQAVKKESLTPQDIHPGQPYKKYGSITNLTDIIIPGRFSDSTYTTIEKRYMTYQVGLFLHHRLEGFPWLALQGDLLMSQVKSGYAYADTAGLTYDMDFGYWFGGLQLAAKIFPGASTDETQDDWWRGFFLRLGVQGGINLTQRGIAYCHEPKAIYGPCEPIEEELNRVLKGKGDLGFVMGLGYDLPIGENGVGIGLDLRYYHGIADVVNTLTNGYEFSSPSNQVRTVQMSISLALPLAAKAN